MRFRRVQWVSVVLVAVGFAASAAAMVAPAPTAAEGALTAEQLIYPGAPVGFQVDVNGEAAVQVVGGVLEAAAEIAREQIPALKKQLGEGQRGGGPGLSLLMSAAPPLIDPAKEAITSITHVTLLVMKQEKSAALDETMAYYNGLMMPRGWQPLATVRAEHEGGVLLLLAPGGKGLFGVLRPSPSELIVGMLTTTKPLGELLGQIVRAAGGQLVPSLLMSFRVRHETPRSAQAPPATAEAPSPPEPPGQE